MNIGRRKRKSKNGIFTKQTIKAPVTINIKIDRKKIVCPYYVRLTIIKGKKHETHSFSPKYRWLMHDAVMKFSCGHSLDIS